MHLLLPLLASVLFVCALIFAQRAGQAVPGRPRIGPVTTLFFANQCSAVVFSLLWCFGGTLQPASQLYQPAIVAALYILGLVFTLMAVEVGDVSIAAPLFGVKVVFVAVILTLTGLQTLPAEVWYAAVLAAIGIGLIQWTGRGQPRRILLTIAAALSAALCYATFDVLVQRWAPAWGAGRFLPIMFWMVGIVSLVLWPWVQLDPLRQPSQRNPLLASSLLLALQAVCIVVTLSVFGDAARVNVVYALRGLWGVALAWVAARIWGGNEAFLGRRVLAMRFVGACLLTVAVAIVTLSRD
ncbi:MAG: EamA/RhaT family transporter [Planctomycetota bacterium]